MNNDLVERYIYAVTKGMPGKQRQDVSMELRSLVDDLLTERCGDAAPSEKDVRIVLTELGTPQELYAQYDADADKCLIGQPYYSVYKFLMKIVLCAVTVGMTVSCLILQILEPQSWWEMVGSWLAMLCNGLLVSFGVVTGLFAFFQRKGIRLGQSFNLDDLPPVPKKSREISKWESIAGIAFCMIFAVLFVFTPEVFSVLCEGKLVSLFDMQVIHDTWFIVTAFALCGITREAVQLMERQYNRRVLLTALVTNGISAVLAIWWLVGFDVMNQTFLANLQTIFAGETQIVYVMFANFDLFFLGVMLFALVLDSIDVTVKTLRK